VKQCEVQGKKGGRGEGRGGRWAKPQFLKKRLFLLSFFQFFKSLFFFSSHLFFFHSQAPSKNQAFCFKVKKAPFVPKKAWSLDFCFTQASIMRGAEAWGKSKESAAIGRGAVWSKWRCQSLLSCQCSCVKAHFLKKAQRSNSGGTFAFSCFKLPIFFKSSSKSQKPLSFKAAALFSFFYINALVASKFQQGAYFLAANVFFSLLFFISKKIVQQTNLNFYSFSFFFFIFLLFYYFESTLH